MNSREGIWVSFEYDLTPMYGWVDIRSPRSYKTIDLVINNNRFVYDTQKHTFSPECCCENLPVGYWGDNYYDDDYDEGE